MKCVLVLIAMLWSGLLIGNDTVIELLEAEGIETQNITPSGVTVSGPSLKTGVVQMVRRHLLVQFVGVDHQSERGVCLKNAITSLLDESGGEVKELGWFGHCGGVFDPPVGGNEITVNPHQLQHQRDVVLAKMFANEQCNNAQQPSRMQVAVITAPQHLVDIIYQLRSPVQAYHLTDGVAYECHQILSVRN